MRLIDRLTAFPDSPPPIVLTLGFFDGVHLGHQAVFARVNELGGTPVCLTFRNHPATLLRDIQIPLLTGPSYKAELIARYGIETVVMLDFTRKFAEQSPADFLAHLRSHIPFSHLILGHDAHLGQHRSGTPDVVRAIAAEQGFEVEYLPPLEVDGERVSSSCVREAVLSGDLDRCQQLLGRRLSYESQVEHGEGLGKRVGYRTANLSVIGTCLPPNGVYAVIVHLRDRDLPGVANLGIAPTLHEHRERLLEVHIFDIDQDLYGETVEVTLHSFIRPEMKFESAEALRTQISQDVMRAQSHLGSA